jgi:hypothetical protein
MKHPKSLTKNFWGVFFNKGCFMRTGAIIVRRAWF